MSLPISSPTPISPYPWRNHPFLFFLSSFITCIPKEYIIFCLLVNGITGVILCRLLSRFICLQDFSMLQVAVVP